MYKPSDSLDEVRYEIRGELAKRAHEMERQGYEIVHLNIGNPGLFGFRTPETMRLAMIENLANSEPYCHQLGVFPAREAIVMQQQSRGVEGATADRVFMGNGVSELIDLCLRGLLDTDDEVLVPSPNYPLWTASVTLNGGNPVHYPCPKENNFEPDLDAMESMITDKTRAIVIINPNNPTGAVYSRETLQAIVDMAEKHNLILFSDEIYDQILFDEAEFIPVATLVKSTLCCTMSGLSKVYRACGYRVGWAVFTGDTDNAGDYLNAVELLASLRLCANVTGQWAVQTALGGVQSIQDLVKPGGRLYDTRQVIIEAVEKSPYMKLMTPKGAMYAFVEVDMDKFPNFDDHEFALDLLNDKHVLLAPGSSFNAPDRNHFRVTLLPNARLMKDVFERIDDLLASYAQKAA